MGMLHSTITIIENQVVFSKEILEYFESLRNEETNEWVDKYIEVLSDTSNFDAPKYNIHHIKPVFTFKTEELNTRRKAEKIAKSVSSCDFLPFSDIPWYKFSPASATKENAILILCKNLGILPEEILAFGDDYNDIGMLKLCGKGIAMGNAISQVKEVSDGTTKTNNEDGAAWYVENFILKD